MAIPWSALVSDSTRLEVSGLELTLRPAVREEAGNRTTFIDLKIIKFIDQLLNYCLL